MGSSWIIKLLTQLNDLGHWSQEKVFSPVWVLLCFFQWALWLNDLKHWSQQKDSSPVWFVLLQIATVRKWIGTLITEKRFFFSMGSSVGLEMGPLIKWLGTLITRKSFLTSIGSSVDLQIPHETKWLGTLTTRKRFLSKICSYMSCQKTTTLWLCHWLHSKGNWVNSKFWNFIKEKVKFWVFLWGKIRFWDSFEDKNQISDIFWTGKIKIWFVKFCLI